MSWSRAETDMCLLSVDVSVRAGDLELYAGGCEDGVLELTGILNDEITVEYSCNGKKAHNIVRWMAGNGPYPFETITLAQTPRGSAA